MDVPAVKSRSLSLAAALGLTALSGCAVGPDFKHPDPKVPAAWPSAATLPAAARASTVSTQPAAIASWWSTFNDATLTSLIERSTTEGLDVREAVLRIAEARAARDLATADFWPALTANTSFTRQRLSLNTPNGALIGSIGRVPNLPPGLSIPNPYSQYQLGLSASWELDLFGRVRRSVEAADADWLASVEAGRDVRVSLASEVARAYMDLRATQLRRRIVTDSLATQRELADLTRQRRDAGLTTDLDVADAAAQVDASQAQLPLIERQLTEDVNELSRLMGREPGALSAELTAVQPLPSEPPVVPIGLPADLVRRRPDIRRAEASLHAATARVGVAVADFFPRLTLGAQGGFQSQALSALVRTASRFGTAGPVLEVPIFEGNRLRATLRVEDVRAQEAAIDYARTVLGALHEVDNALVAYGADQDRRVSLESAVANGRDALRLARQRYASGVTNFVEVLDAERTLQQNELALADATEAVATDLVLLYKTLGGGWQEAQASGTP